MLGKPLRFVLLLDQRLVPAWQAQCIRELMNLNAATLVGVIKRRENLSAPRPGFYSRLKANRSKLLWRAFNRFYVDRFCQASKLQNIS